MSISSSRFIVAGKPGLSGFDIARIAFPNDGNPSECVSVNRLLPRPRVISPGPNRHHPGQTRNRRGMNKCS